METELEILGTKQAIPGHPGHIIMAPHSSPEVETRRSGRCLRIYFEIYRQGQALKHTI